MNQNVTRTLLGRERNLKKYFDEAKKNYKGNRYTKSGALRAAINTPIQGGAADIVIAAMVKLHNDKVLRELGYSLLL